MLVLPNNNRHLRTVTFASGVLRSALMPGFGGLQGERSHFKTKTGKGRVANIAFAGDFITWVRRYKSNENNGVLQTFPKDFATFTFTENRMDIIILLLILLKYCTYSVKFEEVFFQSNGGVPVKKAANEWQMYIILFDNITALNKLNMLSLINSASES